MSLISNLKMENSPGKKDEKAINSSQNMKIMKGIVDALTSLGGVAKDLIVLSNEQVRVEKELQTAIKNTGEAAGMTFGQMKQYASQLQEVSVYSDRVTMKAMALMTGFGSIKGDVFKEAVASAQDLAAAMDTDLNQAVVLLGKALENPETGFRELQSAGASFTNTQIGQIRELVKEGKKQEAQLIMLKELQNEFGGAAKAATNDAYGAQTQLSNAWGDFKEAVGNAITPSADMVKGLTGIVKEQTNIINSKSIPTWKKWLGLIDPVLMSKNRRKADKEQLNIEADERLANRLEIDKKGLGELIELQNEYRTKWIKGADLTGGSVSLYQHFLELLDEEIKKRKEVQETAKKVDEITPLQDVAGMTESTVNAINEKINAYRLLADTNDLNDTKSQDFFANEILRLNKLISKSRELQNARILSELKAKEGGPLNPAPRMDTDQGVALDVGMQLTGGEEYGLLYYRMEAAREQLKPIAQEMVDISTTVNGAFSDMAVGIGTSLGMFMAGAGSISGLAGAVMGTFADLAINIGKTAIATGVAVKGILTALKLQPWAAIAAGIALVAVGTAVKSSLGKAAGGGTFSGNVSMGSGVIDTRTGNLGDKTLEPPQVIVSGQLKARGGELVAVLEAENTRKRYTT